EEIRIKLDGTVVATLITPPYETLLTIPATAATGNELVYVITAEDAAGNVATAEARITVDDAPDNTPPGPVTVQAPATGVPGQVVAVTAAAVDDTGILKVVFLADDVPFDEAGAPPYAAVLPVPADQPVGSQIQVTVRAEDFSGNATTSDPVVLLVVEAGVTLLTGEVYDNATGLPLPGAVVRATPLAESSGEPLGTTVSDERGRFTVELLEGAVVIEVQRGGYTPVSRRVTLQPGAVNSVPDFRLTPLAPPVGVDPRVGARLALALLDAEVTIPAGALASLSEMHATKVGGQGLRALLPPGWSPIGAFHLGPENLEFINPVSVSLAALAENIIAARWDKAQHAWVRLSIAEVAERRELDLDSPGSVVLLKPDVSPQAPPMPAAGEVISGVFSTPIPVDASAGLSPSPDILFMQPGARSEVEIELLNASPLPSGTTLSVEFTESYRRTDGTLLIPPVTRQDIVLYQTEAGMVGRFKASPSEVFDPALLVQGVIHLEALGDGDGTGRKLLGSGGGSVTTPEGITLTVPPGALGGGTVAVQAFTAAAVEEPAGNTAVTLTRLPDLPDGFVDPADFELLAGVEIEVGPNPLSLPATLQLPPDSALPGGARILAARADRVNDASRLVLVGIGTVSESGVEITAGNLGLALPGIDRSGRYYFFLATTPLGYATGNILGGAVEPGRVLAETDASPFVSLVDGSAMPYVLALPVGDSQVQASDLDSGRNAADSATIDAADDIVTLDLELGDARPTVLQVIPANGAIGVATTSSVTVRFSRPMDPTTLTADTVSLLVDAGPVSGSVSLLADGVTGVFQPDSLLAIETLHTLVLAASVQDEFGLPLLGNRPDDSYVTSFTTLDPTPPARPEAGQITSAPPDATGKSVISGTQGTVEPDTVVTVENLTTGVSVSALGQVDGSFSLTVEAGLTDDLDLLLIDQAGNQTRVELGRVTPPVGISVMDADGGLVESTDGSALLIPAGIMPPDTIVSVEPIDTTDLALPFSDVAPGKVGGAVEVSLGGVELAEVMEMTFSIDGLPSETVVDLIPLYQIDRQIQLPDDLLPGDQLTLRVVARDKLGHRTELMRDLLIVAADADTTLVETSVEETPVALLSAPIEAMPGQTISILARAQAPDIKLRFPAEDDLTGDEQFILYEIRDINGQSVLDLADTASLKTLEDGNRIIETNSPPFRGIRRDTSKLVMAVYQNEIISFAQVLSDTTSFGAGGVGGATIGLASSMAEQFSETVVGVSLIQAYSRPRPADVSLYEFAVVPVLGNTPTRISLIDLQTNQSLADAELEALPPGSFSSVLILGEDDNNPQVTATTSLKNDAVPVDASIDLAFSHLIDTTTVTSETLFIMDDTGKKVDAEVVFDRNRDGVFIVKLQPKKALTGGRTYTLNATTGISRPGGGPSAGQSGKPLSSQFTMTFTTAGGGGLAGQLALPEIDSFDMLEQLVVATARSTDGSINSFYTIDVSDPANPTILAERKLNYSIDGGVRAVKAMGDVHIELRDGSILQGDLAIVSAGSPDTFSTVQIYDINDPEKPVFISGTLVGTPVETILQSAEVVVIPNFDDFTDTEVIDPNEGLLDGIPDFPTIPWMIDTNGIDTLYFINQGLGVMTINAGQAIPPPGGEQRGSQLGPSYPPRHKAGGLIITDDPALVKDNGDINFTSPSGLQILTGSATELDVQGDITNKNIGRILVNGFEADITTTTNAEGEEEPVNFKLMLPLHEGYNIITATAFD
ncbi:MAG: Ig-like domain-containing protein, partial [Gammaproteobacteria bacterium]|nr:Ig-like domain-containing protein [Gammaproteobacteria bacterium]